MLDTLCTLVEIDEVPFGAIESEHFARGHPWLTAAEWLPQLAAERFAAREPDARPGNAGLVEHARVLAGRIPTIRGSTS